MPGFTHAEKQHGLRRVVSPEFARILVLRNIVPFGRRHDAPVLLVPFEASARTTERETAAGYVRPVGVAEFRRAQEELLRADAISDAVFGLRSRQPEDSAYWVTTPPQRIAFLGVGLVFLAAATMFPVEVFGGVLSALAAVNLAVALFRLSLAWSAREPDAVAVQAAIPDPVVWPRYTVLVPLYKEAAVVPALAKSIGALKYPADRIEIFLVCEEDDAETVAAAQIASEADPRMRMLAVPACEPRTKPKALNYALAFARGDLLVIYDAEDRPDKDQLVKAVHAFEQGPPDLACVQARLNWYNRDRNWLTRAFALEYALWFDYLLPGLQRLGAPIPLGGTSNHFKIEALIRCGAWDPFNVTEDADLGLRFMRLGGSVATLDSTTLEEATCTTTAWIRQRSRWIKGYMQTWLVQMRDPVRLWRATGLAGFVCFQLFVGGVALTALANPILWAATLYWTAIWALDPNGLVLGSISPWAMVSLFAGNLALMYLNMLCALRRRWLDLVPAALGTPLYWVMISVAGYKALGQLITRPFYWEKTEHGVGASQ